MQASCFFVLQYLNSITFNTGGIGDSDSLLSQKVAGSEEI